MGWSPARLKFDGRRLEREGADPAARRKTAPTGCQITAGNAVILLDVMTVWEMSRRPSLFKTQTRALESELGQCGDLLVRQNEALGDEGGRAACSQAPPLSTSGFPATPILRNKSRS